jgi:hypothetical protein
LPGILKRGRPTELRFQHIGETSENPFATSSAIEIKNVAASRFSILDASVALGVITAGLSLPNSMFSNANREPIENAFSRAAAPSRNRGP